MTDPASWPSLADQLTIAESLFGHDGRQRVAAWLDEQEGLVDNADFARSFADHIDLPGVGLFDYAHRYVRSSGGAVLGGIRFYHRNIERPFVEIVVHSFSDIDALRDCVRVEWSAFSPLFIRLRMRPGRLAAAGARVHKSIYVGRYRDLQPSDGRVSLDRFDNPETAIDIVARRYERLKSDNPALAWTLSAASPEELRAWYDADQLRAIRTNVATVGVLAVVPSEIGWIEGDEVSEEVIDADHNGCGYAAAAQSAWADQVARDRNTLLIGTIHEGNNASRKTAESVGRQHVLDDYVVALKGA
jgi:hypothetical protein